MQTLLARLALAPRWPGAQPGPYTAEQLIVLSSLYCCIFLNNGFWRLALGGATLAGLRDWLLPAALFAVVTAAHCLLFGMLAAGRAARPVLALLLLAAAPVSYFTSRYTVYVDPAMVGNVLHTDVREASEWFNAGLLWHVAWAGMLPATCVLAVPMRRRPWREACRARIVFLAVVLAAGGAIVLLAARELAPLVRNHPQLRYLVTPGNLVTSALRHATARTGMDDAPRHPVAPDIARGAAWASFDKPLLLVIVVGETARAANWGLNGYRRDTTPHLAAAGGINFTDVTSCGTSTEVSLRCMFAPFGRAGYSERRARTHESLLHVLERAAIPTAWFDNQSGCKGVCAGLAQHHLAQSCPGGCLDEVLLQGLAPHRLAAGRPQVIVLHQIGNHGPAYFRRYPERMGRFQPACANEDFGHCTREEIVNAYDNALAYTDHVLGRAIAALREQRTHHAALLYLSDHGESLGEKGLYLHGMPYAIAPAEQTRVPMYLWLSDGFAARTGIDMACLRRQAGAPRSHDDLFHSILGMLHLATRDYRRANDFTAACRGGIR
ncbi:phosphoethanolamine--lipid A transferase [Massilia sp. METH4]|uniref:phosphoethanolamine transferase n=1 Tax=Massilia sp. METH4 TaxID=3123041 RepID=UPI0030D446D7